MIIVQYGDEDDDNNNNYNKTLIYRKYAIVQGAKNMAHAKIHGSKKHRLHCAALYSVKTDERNYLLIKAH